MTDEQDERTSRDQESREGDVIHEEYNDEWEEMSLLDTQNVPARAGFVQRWVRTEINGDADSSNMNRKFNQGWRPRLANTVAKGEFVPTIKYQRSNVIGMQGMILMERPERQHAAHGRAIKADTKNQMRSVDESMFKAHSANSGMTAPERDSSSRVTRGKNVRVADD